MNGVVDMGVAYYKTSVKPEILAKVHQNLQLWPKFGRMQNFGKNSVESQTSAEVRLIPIIWFGRNRN